MFHVSCFKQIQYRFAVIYGRPCFQNLSELDMLVYGEDDQLPQELHVLCLNQILLRQGQIVRRSSAIVAKSGNINISTNLNFLTLKNCFSTPKIFLKMCEHLVILSKLNALKNLLYMKEY